MPQHKIANVLWEDTRQFAIAPLIYVRSEARVTPQPDGTLLLPSAERYDFTTYMNALSVEKWQRYTVATAFSLHLEVRGGAVRFEQTRCGKLSFASETVADSAQELEASDEWQTLDVDLIVGDKDILLGFALETQGACELRNSYYAAEVGEDTIRKVELALCTTTFRKEDYITRNIASVKERILASTTDDIAKHFTMHVIDNGKTLDANALSAKRVIIHPNRNVGGSGGFACGMIHALEQKPVATHVLLMDDDVRVSPESIIRTYNLLTIVRDEYLEAFVSGAMMLNEDPEVRWEDMGFMAPDGSCVPMKNPARVTNMAELVGNETYIPDVASNPTIGNAYAGWWFCCIPTSVIREKGLPLPLFVRYDDIEYSLRCKPKLMTMNGICVWHDWFNNRYDPVVERYQVTRNAFAAQNISGVALESDFVAKLRDNIRLDLVKFDYPDAELALKGFEDFLDGPDKFFEPTFAEEAYMAARAEKEQFVSYEELCEQALAECGFDVRAQGYYELTEWPMLGRKPRRTWYEATHRQLFRRSLNGQLFRIGNYGEDTAFLEARGWIDPIGKLYGVKHVIALDIVTKRGIVRHKDAKRAKAIWQRLEDDLKRYEAERETLRQRYALQFKPLTSMDFWKAYLEM